MSIQRMRFDTDWPDTGGRGTDDPNGDYVLYEDYAAHVAELVTALNRECGNFNCMCRVYSMGRSPENYGACATCKTKRVIAKFAEFLPKEPSAKQETP